MEECRTMQRTQSLRCSGEDLLRLRLAVLLLLESAQWLRSLRLRSQAPYPALGLGRLGRLGLVPAAPQCQTMALVSWLSLSRVSLQSQLDNLDSALTPKLPT